MFFEGFHGDFGKWGGGAFLNISALSRLVQKPSTQCCRACAS
jgi:hypothetical protein